MVLRRAHAPFLAHAPAGAGEPPQRTRNLFDWRVRRSVASASCMRASSSSRACCACRDATLAACCRACHRDSHTRQRIPRGTRCAHKLHACSRKCDAPRHAPTPLAGARGRPPFLPRRWRRCRPQPAALLCSGGPGTHTAAIAKRKPSERVVRLKITSALTRDVCTPREVWSQHPLVVTLQCNCGGRRASTTSTWVSRQHALPQADEDHPALDDRHRHLPSKLLCTITTRIDTVHWVNARKSEHSFRSTRPSGNGRQV
jgi:hypothetical protein